MGEVSAGLILILIIFFLHVLNTYYVKYMNNKVLRKFEALHNALLLCTMRSECLSVTA